MRVLILSQWFDPEPTFKGLAFARELVKLGHQVEVLTGFPNYPGGKLYLGYRVKFFQREMIDEISVVRVPLYPSHDTSAIKRIINYVSFAVSAAILGPLLVKRADVMYVYHPPATIGFAASVIGMFRRIPFVYDIQDLWPDTLAATGMINSPWALRLVDLVCRVIYRRAARIVVLSPGFKKILETRNVPEGKIEVIYNWCDENQIATMSQKDALQLEPHLQGRFNIVFAGTMGKAQALDAVLGAAAHLQPITPHVQFVFIGGGIEVDRLKLKSEQMELSNVLFLPRRPMSQIGSALCAADLLLVHLKDDPLFAITLPSKTQAYLAVGRPVIMAVHGDAAELVERAGAGLACTPEDSQSIVDVIIRFAAMSGEERENMGKKGAEYYQQELALSVGVRKFERIFSDCKRFRHPKFGKI